MKAGDEFQLQGLRLKNRFVMAPLKTALNHPGGRVSADAEKFYERIALGGTALMILEPAAVSPSGVEHPKQLRIHDEEHVGELRRLVDAAHRGGAVAVIHLNHAGRAANPKVIGGSPLAPSPMKCPTTGANAAALSGEEIEKIVSDFGEAADRAVRAGADALEIQCGHGYLLGQFFSPRTNHREDRWVAGGVFAVEVLKKVMENSRGLPIIARISGSEFVEGGLDPENQQDLLTVFERLRIAALHVGFGNSCDNPAWYFGHMALPEAPQIEVLRKIRASTELPLIFTGRMGDPDRIREVLGASLADLIGLARPLVADPEFPEKMIAGNEDRIMPCGACLQACLSRVRSAQPIACMLNPWQDEESATPGNRKRVLVAGGGPAGIAAAVTAARRGHAVRLFEQRKRLGGQFVFAVAPESKSGMSRMLKGMLRRIEHSEVEVHKGVLVTSGLIRDENPDVVIVATGARQRRPDIEGLESRHVITSFEFFEDPGKIRGDRILVLGAGMVGLEVSEMLLAQGKTVVACRRSESIGADMDPISRKMLLHRIGEHPNLRLMPGTTLVAFRDDGVEAIHNGEAVVLEPFDTVVLCSGMEPENTLVEALEGFEGEIIVVGDAGEPSSIEHAFREGVAAGSRL